MKNVTAMVVAALTGAFVSLGVHTYLDRHDGTLVDQTNMAPVQRVSYPMMGTEGSVNFVEAANNSIHSVVHIKTTVTRSGYRSSNPFHQFFFDQGMEPQQQMGNGHYFERWICADEQPCDQQCGRG